MEDRKAELQAGLHSANAASFGRNSAKSYRSDGRDQGKPYGGNGNYSGHYGNSHGGFSGTGGPRPILPSPPSFAPSPVNNNFNHFNSGASNSGGGNRPTCQLCGKLGHIASNCFKRFKREFWGVGYNEKFAERQAASATQGHTPSYPVDPSWYADTGATDHLTNELAKLHMKEPYQGKDQVHTANGSGMRILHVGQSSLPTQSSSPLRLTNVLHVTDVTRNLLSVKKLTRDNNVFVEFHPFDLIVKDRGTREQILRGRCCGELYKFDPPFGRQAFSGVFSGVRVSREKWHCRLGHPASPIIQHVLSRHELPSLLDKNSSVL
jgi:histone deacetylase 1/2